MAVAATPIRPPHAPLPGASTHVAPTSSSRMAPSRIQAILNGRKIDTTVHPELSREEIVLKVENFNLWYGPKQALHDINLVIPRGKITSLIGPSGCGKSTL